MTKYEIKLTPRSIKDIEGIYAYIAENFKDPSAANKLANLFDEAIFSLETFPYRGAERKIGQFKDKGYRQLFVKNFTIIYQIDEHEKHIILMTIRYSPMNF